MQCQFIRNAFLNIDNLSSICIILVFALFQYIVKCCFENIENIKLFWCINKSVCNIETFDAKMQYVKMLLQMIQMEMKRNQTFLMNFIKDFSSSVIQRQLFVLHDANICFSVGFLSILMCFFSAATLCCHTNRIQIKFCLHVFTFSGCSKRLANLTNTYVAQR